MAELVGSFSRALTTRAIFTYMMPDGRARDAALTAWEVVSGAMLEPLRWASIDAFNSAWLDPMMAMPSTAANDAAGLDARIGTVLVEQGFDALVDVGDGQKAVAGFRDPAQDGVRPAGRAESLTGRRRQLVLIELHGKVERDPGARGRQCAADTLKGVEVVHSLERRQG